MVDLADMLAWRAKGSTRAVIRSWSSCRGRVGSRSAVVESTSSEYEHGTIITGGEDAVFGSGQVRRALESTARTAGLDDDAVPDYVHAVRSLVLRDRGRTVTGSILVVNSGRVPAAAGELHLSDGPGLRAGAAPQDLEAPRSQRHDGPRAPGRARFGADRAFTGGDRTCRGSVTCCEIRS